MALRWNRRKRGAALLFVLFVTTLAVMFLGALMATNVTAIRMASGAATDRSATANAQSGLEYTWQLLERDRNFGRTLFTDNGIPPGFNAASARLQLRLRNPNGNLGTQFLEGRFLDKPDSGFRVFLYNRIPETTAATDASVPFLRGRRVQGESVMIHVVGFEGQRQRVLEALLNRAPFVSHSVLAGGEVHFKQATDTAQWRVRSFDAFRNSLFTKGHLNVENITSGSLLFQPNSGAPSPMGRYGAALAANEVQDGGTALTASTLSQASSEARGLLLPNARQENRIKELNPEDLKMPENVVELPAGAYRFERTAYEIKIEWEEERVVGYTPLGQPIRAWLPEERTESFYAKGFSRYANESATQPLETWIPSQNLPAPPSGPRIRNGEVTLNTGHISTTPVTVDGTFDLRNASGQVAAQVNLVEGTFDIPANTMLQVNGDFVLQHRQLTTEDKRPKLRLVNDVSVDASVTDAVTAGMRTTGNLKIEGGLRGSGTLIAGGDLSMYAESRLATTTARPVALFANNNVSLLRDDQATMDESSPQTLSADWAVFKRSLSNETALDDYLNDPFATQNTKANGFLDRPIFNEGGTAPDPDPSYYLSQVLSTYLTSAPAAMRQKVQTAYADMISDGQMTLSEAIRLREYARQLPLDATATVPVLDPETGAPIGEEQAVPVADRWLNESAVRAEVALKVQEQLASYSIDVPYTMVDGAPVYQSLRTWFNDVATNPFENDQTRLNSVFRGLVYSRFGNFLLDANYNGLSVFGSLVVPRGTVRFQNASGIETVYDPRYLKDLLKPGDAMLPLKLDQLFWRLY